MIESNGGDGKQWWSKLVKRWSHRIIGRYRSLVANVSRLSVARCVPAENTGGLVGTKLYMRPPMAMGCDMGHLNWVPCHALAKLDSPCDGKQMPH